MIYIRTTNTDHPPERREGFTMESFGSSNRQGRDHGDKQLNWKFCCYSMALVLPLDGSIREVGETREAISKYAIQRVGSETDVRIET